MSEQEHNEQSHNDPIERLFQDKADQYDIEYNENDWLKLKDRLDQADRKRRRTIRRRWIAAAALLAFAFLGYLTIENQMQINRLNDQLSQYQSANPEQPAQVQSDDPENPTNNEKEPTGKDPATEGDKMTDNNNQTAAPGTRKNETSDQQPPAPQEDMPADSEDQFAQQKGQTKQATPPLAAADSLDRTSTQDLGRTTATIAMQSVAAQELSRASAVMDNSESAGIFRAELPSAASSTGLGTSPTEEEEREESGMLAATRRSPALSLDRVSVGVIVGPDLSTVGSISNFYDPGYEYGVTVEYTIGKNLGLATGLIRSRVKYSASGSEYNPAGSYWGYGTRPAQTIGDCVLLDIPLQVKYNFWNLEGSRFYAVGGLSSYIMLTEEYRFDYGYGYGSNRPQQWSDDTGTQHWMSNASLSIGYEYDMAKNWSLRAAPYLKVPIKEVGWGNVKLYSMGMTVSFNYNL